MIKVIGAKGNIQDIDLFLKQILSLSEEYKIVIQVINADIVYGKNHLISASQHSVRAFEQKKNSTNSLAMEILLYASGERQIQRAIQKVGIKKGNENIALVFIDEFQENGKVSNNIVGKILEILNLIREDKVLEGDNDTLRKFGITHQELMTVPKNKHRNLILEKVAMVDVIK
jgi:KEOPS complex subunit Cgi121